MIFDGTPVGRQKDKSVVDCGKVASPTISDPGLARSSVVG